jgi:hypothetical protein
MVKPTTRQFMFKHKTDHIISKTLHAALQNMGDDVITVDYKTPNSFYTTYRQVLQRSVANKGLKIINSSTWQTHGKAYAHITHCITQLFQVSHKK